MFKQFGKPYKNKGCHDYDERETYYWAGNTPGGAAINRIKYNDKE